MVTQIAGASAQQASASQSVKSNLNQISSISERTASSAAKSVDACGYLSNLAEDLNELVGAFKVHDVPM
jgi:methyl-accepting chemotaxis protein